MALKGSISRTLSYNSMIGDMVAVYMSATIPDDGVPSRSMIMLFTGRTKKSAGLIYGSSISSWTISRMKM